jgi:prenyltransferase beta subunit
VKRYSFCLVCLLLAAPAWAQTADEKKASIAYLRQLQGADGGFVAAVAKGERGPSTLRATSATVRALHYLGGEVPDVEKCKKYVALAFDSQLGGFRDVQPETLPDVTSTAVGLMAMAELKMATDRVAPAAEKFLTANVKTFEDIRIAAAGMEAVGRRAAAAEKWLEVVAKGRNDSGTYGKGDGAARDTGGSVVTVLRLGGKVESEEAVLKVLNAGQRPDGGFGKAGAKSSDLETTYRVVRCYVMLKQKPDVKKLFGFVARCRNDDGGYSSEPGQPSNVGATYFAAILHHWLAGK